MVIVYMVAIDTAVGVPLITHVEASIDNPAESDGDAEHAVMACPFVVRVLGVILMDVPTTPLVPDDKR